ncbi:hypothetical protein BACERE00185_05052 [Bacillus mobilis]|uniref:Uncharacterized protein n=1 Tax=Bacillus mobilis TaxID=2026190 RepID=A0A1Y6APH3_9BACI|nr:hypothetical protein BACERE00185_05052 [Bacillus mobilis]
MNEYTNLTEDILKEKEPDLAIKLFSEWRHYIPL